MPALLPLSDGTPGLRSIIPVTVRAPALSEIENQKSKIENSFAPTLDFISSDETLDRYSEIISASGWHLDTYRRNPIFQNAHQYGDIIFTLGKALITEIREVGRSEVGRVTPCAPLDPPREAPNQLSTINSQPSTFLFQRIQFATDVNPMAKIAYGLYAGGFLKAVSVGFVPLRWQDGPESSSSSSSSIPPQVARGQARRIYLEQELLEVSAVAIPANPNALALALKSGALEKSDIRDTADLLSSLCSADSALPRSADFVAVRQDSAVSPIFNRQPSISQTAPAPSPLILHLSQLRDLLKHLSSPALSYLCLSVSICGF